VGHGYIVEVINTGIIMYEFTEIVVLVLYWHGYKVILFGMEHSYDRYIEVCTALALKSRDPEPKPHSFAYMYMYNVVYI